MQFRRLTLPALIACFLAATPVYASSNPAPKKNWKTVVSEFPGNLWKTIVGEIETNDIGATGNDTWIYNYGGVGIFGGIDLRPLPGHNGYLRREVYRLDLPLSFTSAINDMLEASLPIGLSFDMQRSVNYFRYYKTQEEAIHDKNNPLWLRLPKAPWAIPRKAEDVLALAPGTSVRIPAVSSFAIGYGENRTLWQTLSRDLQHFIPVNFGGVFYVTASYEVVFSRSYDHPELLRMQVISLKESSEANLPVRISVTVGDELQILNGIPAKTIRYLTRKLLGQNLLDWTVIDGHRTSFSLVDFTFNSKSPDAMNAYNAVMQTKHFTPDLKTMFNVKSVGLEDARYLHGLFNPAWDQARELARKDQALPVDQRRVIQNMDGYSHVDTYDTRIHLNAIVYHDDHYQERTYTLATSELLGDVPSHNFSIGQYHVEDQTSGFMGWRKDLVTSDFYVIRRTDENGIDGLPLSPFSEVGFQLMQQDAHVTLDHLDDTVDNLKSQLGPDLGNLSERFVNILRDEVKNGDLKDGEINFKMRLSPVFLQNVRRGFLDEFLDVSGQDISNLTKPEFQAAYKKYLYNRVSAYVRYYYAQNVGWFTKMTNWPKNAMMCFSDTSSRIADLLQIASPEQSRQIFKDFVTARPLNGTMCASMFRQVAMPIFANWASRPETLVNEHGQPISLEDSHRIDFVGSLVSHNSLTTYPLLTGDGQDYRDEIKLMLDTLTNSKDPTRLYWTPSPKASPGNTIEIRRALPVNE